MKLDVLNPQLEGQARPRARTMELNLRGAWLRELERAQLDDWFRIRVTPEAGMAPPLNPGDPAAVSATRATAPGIEGPASAAVIRQGSEAGARFAPAGESAVAEPAPPCPAAGTSASPRFRAGTPGMPAGASHESTAAPDAADCITSSPIPTPSAARAHASAAHDAAAETGSKKAPAENGSAGMAVVPKSRQWPLRSVHMMAEGSEARVWIRDSGLTRSSIAGILSALTGELARRGLRLRALFVNGRSAFNAESAPGSETHRTSAGGGPADRAGLHVPLILKR